MNYLGNDVENYLNWFFVQKKESRPMAGALLALAGNGGDPERYLKLLLGLSRLT